MKTLKLTTASRLLAEYANELDDEVFQDKDEIGPKMLSQIARHTGLRPEDI